MASRHIGIVAASLPLSACLGSGPAAPDPQFAATPAMAPSPPIETNGAIFRSEIGYTPLTSGARAGQVGDVLTVRLLERTIATKANSAGTAKDTELGIAPPTTGPFALFDPSDVALGAKSSFTGSGRAAQSNRLAGTISVTVAAVYPNGTMRIQGEKQVRLNRGDEFIRFAGIVRGADIASDNSVASDRVADARITYAGSGEVAQASRQGWLKRFFNTVSPF